MKQQRSELGRALNKIGSRGVFIMQHELHTYELELPRFGGPDRWRSLRSVRAERERDLEVAGGLGDRMTTMQLNEC